MILRKRLFRLLRAILVLVVTVIMVNDGAKDIYGHAPDPCAEDECNVYWDGCASPTHSCDSVKTYFCWPGLICSKPVCDDTGSGGDKCDHPTFGTGDGCNTHITHICEGWHDSCWAPYECSCAVGFCHCVE